ncbi:GDSL-type esterase/lipase family protein [Roseomonas populi]|uniref:GDSL-type esterase/lipase family protein n=1 Tax=Roseomonas populi TaxID=3121582 RepID=A0ABT1X6F1_9PROT|nr:GDSL-type esterase/lipase family protein [Roseomonas pecuniae]MCR0983682.1 GDSL-type esterase/lipase family protein [Roseomonas pecuniae]
MKQVSVGRILVPLLAALAVALPSPQAAAESCGAGPGSGLTTTPQVRRGHEVRFQDRLSQIESALNTERFDAIVVGDSIVQQWPADMLAQVFPGRRVLNAGVGGDGTAALLHRLDSAREPAVVQGQRIEIGVSGWERQRPSDVVVLIGTNDLRRATPCDIVAGVLAVVGRLHRLYPAATIHVLSILPRGATQEEFVPEIGTVNASLAGMASSSGRFRFVDARAALLCGQGAACGVARPPNFVHLTREGYAALGRALRAELSRQNR